MIQAAATISVNFLDYPLLILGFLGANIRNVGPVGATAMMNERFARMDLDDRALEDLASKFLAYLVRTDARIDQRKTYDIIIRDMIAFRDERAKGKRCPAIA